MKKINMSSTIIFEDDNKMDYYLTLKEYNQVVHMYRSNMSKDAIIDRICIFAFCDIDIAKKIYNTMFEE